LLRVHDGKLICDWIPIVETVKVLKTQESSAKVTLPDLRLPEGVSFEAVSIAFVGDDWVSTSISGKPLGRFSFAHLGLADGRKQDRPNRLWETLRTFAEHGGSVHWGKTDIPEDIHKNLKKSVQRLRKHLRHLFHTQADPFHPYSKNDGYRCRFRIADESFGGVGRSRSLRQRKNENSL
jgi:hypothetical protein